MHILQDARQFLLILLVILEYNPLQCHGHYHHHHTPKPKPVEKGKKDEFVCNSGQCIDKGLICDGIAHCHDRSDETSKLCSSIGCPSFMFRCDYGACVTISSICDGVPDCCDGSDEPPHNKCELPPNYTQTFAMISTQPTPTTTTTKRYTPFEPTQWTPPSTKTTPTHTPATPTRTKATPTHTPATPTRTPATPTHATVTQTRATATPTRATATPTRATATPTRATATPTRATTPTRTAATPTQTITTVTTPPVTARTGQCQLPEKTTERSYTINECLSNTANPICSAKDGEFVDSGSVLYFTCEREKYTYENDVFTAYCLAGEWLPSIVPCKSCGILPTGKTDGNMPWQAAIYEKSLDRPACWGSVISPYVLISAAHCFFDEALNWKKDVAGFYATVGNFDGKVPDKAQLFNITNVRFSQDGFQGTVTNYAADIAIVEIIPTLQFSAERSMVCLETTDPMVNEKKTGMISLYQPLNTNSPLEIETLQYLEYTDCVNAVSDSFKELVASDKICILNKAIEIGNAGKGFYTQRSGESVLRLHGVVSTTFVDTSTNRQVLTITDLTKHLSWISEMITEINQNRRTSETIDVRFQTGNTTKTTKSPKKKT